MVCNIHYLTGCACKEVCSLHLSFYSAKEFKLDSTTDEEESSLITVDQLITIPVNQHVTLAGKIVTVNVATDLSTKMGKN